MQVCLTVILPSIPLPDISTSYAHNSNIRFFLESEKLNVMRLGLSVYAASKLVANVTVIRMNPSLFPLRVPLRALNLLR